MYTLTHEGDYALRLAGPGRTLLVDPRRSPDPQELVVLLWGEFERVDATARATHTGLRPTVFALQPILFWLQGLGRVEGTIPPVQVDGWSVELLAYTPIPYAAGLEVAWKGLSALRRPVRAAQRLMRRMELPDCKPVIASVTLPDGRRLLHLNLALHRDTPAAWLEQAVKRFGHPDILVVGVDAGEEEAVTKNVPLFAAKQVWVADLVGDVRRHLGLPRPHPERVVQALGGSARLLPVNTPVDLDL